MHVSVANDFSRYPGPRYISQGEHSGEAFRKVLVERLREADRLIVDLDGTSGFGSSFLDEAFGGLIRAEGMDRAAVRSRIKIKSDMDASYKDDVEEAIDLAKQQ